jgi:hypothetical protein
MGQSQAMFRSGGATVQERRKCDYSAITATQSPLESILESLVNLNLDAGLCLVCLRAVASQSLLGLGEVRTDSLRKE